MGQKKLTFQVDEDDLEQASNNGKDVISTCLTRVLGVKTFTTEDGVYGKWPGKNKKHTLLLGSLCKNGIKFRDKLQAGKKVKPFDFCVQLDAGYSGKSEKFRDYAIDMVKAEYHSKENKKKRNKK